MKSVLFIGTGVPWAGSAGYLVRQHMFLRALAEVARLDLALFGFPSHEEMVRPSFVGNVTPLPLPVRRRDTAFGALLADFLTPCPRMFRGYAMTEARRLVRNLRPAQFDAVFCFRIDFGHFAGVLFEPHLLLDVDDPEHTRWRRHLEVTVGAKGDFRTRQDLRKLARFEKAAVRRAKASFVCQIADRETFANLPLLAPNCVEVPLQCPPRRARGPRVAFVGNFSSPRSPNVDGLTWFLGQIWPGILRAVPGCELHVIGHTDGIAAHQIAAAPGARAVGVVEDLGAALGEASLSVAPIRFGTGTRIKILDSFAQGCPVVSTPLGCEGIPATHGKDILLADTPSDFSGACVTLLHDQNLQERLGEAGYDLVASHYNETKQRPQLAETLARLLSTCVECENRPISCT
jgi:polysaccharide biosynthesis protein PslH